MPGWLTARMEGNALLRGISSVVDLWPTLPPEPAWLQPSSAQERVVAVQNRFRAAVQPVFGDELDWRFIAESANSNAPGSRELAARQLSGSSDRSDASSASIEILNALAHDEDSGVRRAAIQALGSHRAAAVDARSVSRAGDENEGPRQHVTALVDR